MISPVQRAVEGQHQLGVSSVVDVAEIVGDADVGGARVVVLAVAVVVAVASAAAAALQRGVHSPRTTPVLR